jgi:HEPN domain-containing protein
MVRCCRWRSPGSGTPSNFASSKTGYIICNLCQQAAEKHIKGFLISKRVEFRKTHDLVALLELAKTDNVDISVLLDKCAFLFQYAVEARYPNQHEYTEAEKAAWEALHINDYRLSAASFYRYCCKEAP